MLYLLNNNNKDDAVTMTQGRDDRCIKIPEKFSLGKSELQ